MVVKHRSRRLGSLTRIIQILLVLNVRDEGTVRSGILLGLAFGGGDWV